MIILEDSKHDELEDILNSYLEEFYAEFELYLQAIKDIRFPEVCRNRPGLGISFKRNRWCI